MFMSAWQESIRKFWARRGWVNYLFLPLSLVYLLGFYIKTCLLQRPKKSNAYVVCVGNAIVGGSGKTPFAISLGRALIERGYAIAYIASGYNSGCDKSAVTNVSLDDACIEVGDEALLLRSIAPTYICKDRYKAAQMAYENGAQIIIMDDGYQNNTIVKDFNILLVGSAYGFGNGFVLPAGPLREFFFTASKRADEIVYIDENSAELYCDVDLRDRNVCIMTGIANPSNFIFDVKRAKASVIAEYIYSDHYNYTKADLLKVIDFANACDALIVVTSKDLVKIPSDLKGNFSLIEKRYNISSKLVDCICDELSKKADALK